MKSGRGGSRENAGRKTSWVSGRGFDKTKIIRVPVEFADQLLQIAHKLDAGENLESVTNSTLEKLDLVTDSVQESQLELRLEKELVTKSLEQGIIESVRDVLAKWRQQSNQAKITSPKSERWAKARQMLNELESVVKTEIVHSQDEDKSVVKPEQAENYVQLDFVTQSYNDNKLVEFDLDTKSLREESDELEDLWVNVGSQINTVPEHVLEQSTPPQVFLLAPSKTIDKSVDEVEPLSRKQLAQRFQLSERTIKNNSLGKAASTFEDWSRAKDPQGIAWKYSGDRSKLYHPVAENVTDLYSPIDETVTNSYTEVVSENQDMTT